MESMDLSYVVHTIDKSDIMPYFIQFRSEEGGHKIQRQQTTSGFPTEDEPPWRTKAAAPYRRRIDLSPLQRCRRDAGDPYRRRLAAYHPSGRPTPRPITLSHARLRPLLDRADLPH